MQGLLMTRLQRHFPKLAGAHSGCLFKNPAEMWKEFGFNAVVYLAALTGISPALYEAAAIDGASRWQRMLHITLPGLKPIIVLMTILALGNILNAGFDQIYNIYNQAVYSTGDIINTWVYRVGLNDLQFSLATAVG